MIKRKTAVIVTAFVLLLGCFVGGTVAYLISSTGTITNTFTVGNVSITLTETKPGTNTTVNGGEVAFNSVPGSSVTKDAKVTVDTGSENCWLFIKVVESNNTITGLTDKVLQYAIADGWTKYADTNIWYKANCAAESSHVVFKDNKVTYNANILKTHVDIINNANTKPTIKVSAAAVQSANIATVEAAYAQLPAPFTGN